MKVFYSIIITFLISNFCISTAFTQTRNNSGFDIDVDPIAYTLNGFSVHGGYINGAYRFDIGFFGIDLPEWLHGNKEFEASFVGAGWKVDRFFKNLPEGLFAGIEGNISRMNVTHIKSDQDQDHIGYTLGIRSGYRWNTGLGKLFLTPWVGLGYNLNAKDITIDGNTFEASPLQPFLTLHLGWKI